MLAASWREQEPQAVPALAQAAAPQPCPRRPSALGLAQERWELAAPWRGGRGRELCRLSSLLWRCHPVGSSLLDVSDRLGRRALLRLGRVPFLDHYTPAPEDIRRPAIEFQCLFCIWLCFEVQFDTDRSDVLKTKRVRESSQNLFLRRFRVEAGHEHGVQPAFVPDWFEFYLFNRNLPPTLTGLDQ